MHFSCRRRHHLITPQLAAYLEAEALHTNEQLLTFEVRSHNVDWRQHVTTVQRRAPAVYLRHDYQLMSNKRETVPESNRCEVLVCHDMMGNYLEDRHYHSSKKYDDYRFHHWAGIDYFCYFSHKYITIPPCGWINAAHNHGVRVLGTYIVEGSKGSQLLEQVLVSKETIDDVVTAMTRLCKHFVFDGWLLNIECSVKPELMENLYYFVSRLRDVTARDVNDGVVFWYDSVIDTGELNWQNELNSRNVRFFKSSDATLLNYNWKDESLEATQRVCDAERSPKKRVFFGIDVFGRGQVAKFLTKKTLARVAQRNFSVGIFAPAWTFETLQNFSYDIRNPLGSSDVNESFLSRNDKWWNSLWEYLATHPYCEELPFYTDFCLGSGKLLYKFGRPTTSMSSMSDAKDVDNSSRFFNLSCQSLQPSVPLNDCAVHHYDDAFNGGSCLRIVKEDTPFRIFAFDIRLSMRGLVIGYAFKLNRDHGELDCVMRFCDEADSKRDCYLFCGDYFNTKTLQQGRCYVSPLKPEYLHLLSDDNLASEKLPKALVAADSSSDWCVRYYIVGFDAPVRLLDFGVLFRSVKSDQRQNHAMLGAVYLQQFDINVRGHFDERSNYAYLNMEAANLFNSA